MPLQPDARYTGTVLPGSTLTVTQTGTMAYQVSLECADGLAVFPIWLTDKNRERARKSFEALGADVSRLSDPKYLEYEIANVITGRTVSFGTRAEEYRGKTQVKVVWIGKPTDPNLARGAAAFFGAAPVEPEPAELTEDSIPF